MCRNNFKISGQSSNFAYFENTPTLDLEYTLGVKMSFDETEIKSKFTGYF
jgi:hypothetical protein